MFTNVRADHLAAYTDAMAKGMEEKLFFLDHLPLGSAVLDFGCADGRMLEAMAIRRPDLALAGLDCSDTALHEARVRGVPAALMTSTTEGQAWAKGQAPHRPVFLLASSVLHEVAHYGGAKGWAEFWDFIDDSPFTGIAVRDFSLSRMDATQPGGAFAAAVRAGLPDWQRCSFESLWGPIRDQGRAVHAALKAPWTASWDREGPEHYFPIWREELAGRITARFTPTLWSPHIHAYSDSQAKARFGCGFPCPTHLAVFAQR